jgi:hypothetical protein
MRGLVTEVVHRDEPVRAQLALIAKIPLLQVSRVNVRRWKRLRERIASREAGICGARSQRAASALLPTLGLGEASVLSGA